MKKIVVIGAGLGGLTAAAILARAGLDVTVLEAQVYPGGCAATFFHQGYFFDAGATLAGGFYQGGPMDLVAQAAGIKNWNARPDPLAMTVHMPNGMQVPVWGDERRWGARLSAFGRKAMPFWLWQEATADALWELALDQPPWPPQTARQWFELGKTAAHWAGSDPCIRLRPSLIQDAFRPLARHLPGSHSDLSTFIDAQLLISSQTTSVFTNALYGASALDLPRRGVVHLQGGMGAIASQLAKALQRHGGSLHLRQTVNRIEREHGRVCGVRTHRGDYFAADVVIANLPPWNIARLEEHQSLPPALRKLKPMDADAWSAFVLYLGVENSSIPRETSLHHQIVVSQPLGEGNSIFLSISPEWDTGRAPTGMRAVTISTHTRLAPWWHLSQHDQPAYQQRRQLYADRLLQAAEKTIPGISQAVRLSLPGTPVTFNRFTRRVGGWVGGFPQTSLFRQMGPRLDRDLWMVGDSIFPGQSAAATSLGGMRVAHHLVRTHA